MVSGQPAIASGGDTDEIAPALLPTHQVWPNQRFSASLPPKSRFPFVFMRPEAMRLLNRPFRDMVRDREL
jgi:hypothetical protein